MTREEHTSWAKHHATVFGLTADGVRMLISWFDIFRGFGYTLSDLQAATRSLAAEPPEFPNQHLARVQAAVTAGRRDRAKDQRLRQLGPASGELIEGELGVCVLCSGTGQVVVPHPLCVQAGRLTSGATAAVVCSCWTGRKLVEAYERADDEYRRRVGRQMTFAEYQRVVPNWRELLAEYETAVARAAYESGPPAGIGRADWDRLSDSMDGAYAAVVGRAKQARAAAG